VFGGYGVFYLLKKMKGKITIDIERSTYNIGEHVVGTAKIEINNATEVNSCVVALIGEDVISYKKRGKRKEKRSEIYSDKIKAIGPGALPSGYSEIIDFKFKIPDPKNFMYFDEDKTESLLDNAIDFIRQDERRVEWGISTIIDAKGIDLDSYEQIYINQENS